MRFKFVLAGLLATVSFMGLSVHALAQDQDDDVLAFAAAQKQTVRQVKPHVDISEEDIKRFALAMRYVQYNYVKDVSFESLFSHAIRGMVRGLDPHSEYLSKKDFVALQKTARGEYVGIGVQLSSEKGLIKVISPFDGSPASEAGIKPGDLILKVNGTLVSKMGVSDAVNAIRGPKNTKIKLVIARKGVKKPIALEITRRAIQISSIESKRLPANVGYVRIRSFSESSAKDLQEALKKLNKKHSIQALVLDMRNNPGGLLWSSIDISDLFLDAKRLGGNKTIVQIKGRHKDNERAFKAHPGDVLHGKPIVVLINQGSASASEIVAAALQDHNRAVVLGTRSFGKGSIQAVFLMDKTSALKLTTGLYFTPLGHSIQGNGIEPDVYVPYTTLPKDASTASWLNHFQESNYKGSLTSDKQKQHKRKEKMIQAIHKMAKEDFQLYQAYNMVQGMESLED